MPRGFPTIAAFHAKYANTRTCRAFHFLTQRLTTLYQCQLTCLLGALVNLDVEGATTIGVQGEDGSQPALFDTDKFISRCLQSPDQVSLVQAPARGSSICEEDEQQKKDRIDAMRENLVANIERIFDKYCMSLLHFALYTPIGLLIPPQVTGSTGNTNYASFLGHPRIPMKRYSNTYEI